VPATLIALVNDGWQHALIVAALIVGIFQLEGHVISPRVQSESVGLSPLAVIVAILIGGDLLGLAGMFLAVPAAAIVRVLALNFLPGFRRPAVPAVPHPAEPAVAAPKRRRQGAGV
jgi:predicted PurR-regulated permease PerM